MAVSGELISAVLKDWAKSENPASTVAEVLAKVVCGGKDHEAYEYPAYLNIECITDSATEAGVEWAITSFDEEDLRLAVEKIEDAVREQLATQAKEIATSMLRELAEACKQESEPELAASA